MRWKAFLYLSCILLANCEHYKIEKKLRVIDREVLHRYPKLSITDCILQCNQKDSCQLSGVLSTRQSSSICLHFGRSKTRGKFEVLPDENLELYMLGPNTMILSSYRYPLYSITFDEDNSLWLTKANNHRWLVVPDNVRFLPCNQRRLREMLEEIGKRKTDFLHLKCVFVFPLGFIKDLKTVSLRPESKPGYYLREKNFLTYIEKNDGTESFKEQASFRLHTNHWHEGCMAFESFKHANFFLRQRSYRIMVHAQINNKGYQDDACFLADK